MKHSYGTKFILIKLYTPLLCSFFFRPQDFLVTFSDTEYIRGTRRQPYITNLSDKKKKGKRRAGIS